MYILSVAVVLLSTHLGLAGGYSIRPNSNLQVLINANRLENERLHWKSPFSTKNDQAIVLDVCGTFRVQQGQTNMVVR